MGYLFAVAAALAGAWCWSQVRRAAPRQKPGRWRLLDQVDDDGPAPVAQSARFTDTSGGPRCLAPLQADQTTARQAALPQPVALPDAAALARAAVRFKR